MICKLKELLNDTNTSSRALSKNAGISVQQVMNIVHGKSVPKLYTASRIANSFGVSIGDIWPDVGDGSAETQKENILKLNQRISDLEKKNGQLQKRLDEATEAISNS
jgi:DNA-binding XRE family transcriptional regulator